MPHCQVTLNVKRNPSLCSVAYGSHHNSFCSSAGIYFFMKNCQQFWKNCSTCFQTLKTCSKEQVMFPTLHAAEMMVDFQMVNFVTTSVPRSIYSESLKHQKVKPQGAINIMHCSYRSVAFCTLGPVKAVPYPLINLCNLFPLFNQGL